MKTKFYEKIIIFSWIIFLYICLGLLSFTSHAASDQDYFPIEQNKNGHFTDDVISTLANYYNDESNYMIIYYFDNNYRVFVFPKTDYTDNLGQLCGEKYSNLYQFSLYQLGELHPTVYQCQIIYGTVYSNYLASGSASYGYFSGLQSSNYNTSLDYISNLKIWTTNNSSKKLVINYDEEPEYSDPDNDTYPNNFEKPNIGNYYKPDNAPGFDGSSVEKAVESLYTLLKWYFQDLNGLPGLFQYIIDNTNWAIQKVINNLRNVITELQEAVEDFSETVSGYIDDIKDYFDYITEPVNSDVIYDNISGTSLVSNITTIQNSLTTFQSSFTSVAEPSEYKIPIHLENLPESYFGIQTVQYIDLGVIDGTVKSGLRIFVWAMVTYGLVITIFDSISNYINAGGDE